MGDADVLIFGMGRTGSAAYHQIEQDGFKPLGLDADTYTAKAHQEAGRNVMFADAEDSNFWRSCHFGQIKAAILAMDDLEAKLIAARSLRQRGFTGPIVSHALHDSHQEQIREAGANYTYLTMNQAGISLAEHTAEAMRKGETG